MYDDVNVAEALDLGLIDPYEAYGEYTPERELEERWDAFRAHEIAAVMSGQPVRSPADFGL